MLPATNVGGGKGRGGGEIQGQLYSSVYGQKGSQQMVSLWGRGFTVSLGLGPNFLSGVLFEACLAEKYEEKINS